MQLHLGTAAQPRLVDTLVMANLGYFQLKAAPGVFVLRLAPGRSADLYTVDNSTDGAVAEDTAQARIQTCIVHWTYAVIHKCWCRQAGSALYFLAARRQVICGRLWKTCKCVRAVGGHRQPVRAAHDAAAAQAQGL